MAITHVQSDYNAQTNSYGPRYVVTTYEGRVLSVYNRDYRAMSDVYTLATFALVLGDDGHTKEVLVNANFECDTSCGRASVDATPEVLEWCGLLDAERKRLDEERRAQRAAAEAERVRNTPVKGKKMEVVRGKKVAVGTVGVVAYVREDRVLLKDEAVWKDRNANGVWVNAAYLKAV